MNKKLLILLTIALIAIPAASACGRTTVTSKVGAPAVPHAVDVRFQNCNACHASDQLAAKPLPHVDAKTGKGLYTNAQCTQKGCHASSSSTTPPSSTPVSSTPVSSAPSSSTPGSSAPASSTAPAGKALGTTPETLDSNHPASYATMCLACHSAAKSGDAVANPPEMPTAGTWAGSASQPGPWTVAAGAAGDHTGRTDVATCVTCHKFAS